MSGRNQNSRTLIIATILATVPLFSACGGGEEKSASSDNQGGGTNLVGCLVGLFLGQTDAWCGSSSSSGSSGTSGGSASYNVATGSAGTSSGSASTSPSGRSGPIVILGQDEIEPNNDLMNAQVVTFNSSAEERKGFKVNASISDVDDQNDYFTFVRPWASDLRFELCPPGEMICESSMQIDSLTAFYEILDQDGNVLASTQAAEFNTNILRIEAGLSYYVRVTAGDTMGATVGYTLTVYETN